MIIRHEVPDIQQVSDGVPEPPLSEQALVTEQYLNGLRNLYEGLGRCSCRGDDLQLILPEDRGLASASYIGGIVMIADRVSGKSEVFTIDDDGLVNHTSVPQAADMDTVSLASSEQVGHLFDQRLVGAELVTYH